MTGVQIMLRTDLVAALSRPGVRGYTSSNLVYAAVVGMALLN